MYTKDEVITYTRGGLAHLINTPYYNPYSQILDKLNRLDRDQLLSAIDPMIIGVDELARFRTRPITQLVRDAFAKGAELSDEQFWLITAFMKGGGELDVLLSESYFNGFLDHQLKDFVLGNE